MEEIKKQSEFEHYFQDMDHSDLKTVEGHASLRKFIAGMLSYYPWWIVMLFRIRGLFVNILGLVKHEKPETLPDLKPESISFTPGDNASFFIVSSAREDDYWVAETPEDKHLKAYFGIVTKKLTGDQTRFTVFTSVKYLHWTGPVYFNLIRPFHHLVVSRMMKAGLKN